MIDCEGCRKRREAIVKRMREIMGRNPFGKPPPGMVEFLQKNSDPALPEFSPPDKQGLPKSTKQ